MITIKNDTELAFMRESGRVLADVLRTLSDEVKPGVTTAYLDELARQKIKERGAEPSFLDYESGGRKYPAALCASINDELVHGLPTARELKVGDIVSLDLGVNVNGYHTDAAVTVPVGKISRDGEKITKLTREALDIGMSAVKAGAHTGDIGSAVSAHAERNGLGVVRDLVGHGIGREVHEEPSIPNYGEKGHGTILKPGMTICIEPMLSLGDFKVKLADDGWTYKMADGSLSAHFEHTLLVTESGYEVLTKNNI